MRRDRVMEVLSEHKAGLQEFDVKSLAVFGSVSRDEAGPESDVDILVEFRGMATFDRYIGLKFFLEDLLGQKVDLVTHRSLRRRLAPLLKEEALYIS